jgi:hypothetical protein
MVMRRYSESIRVEPADSSVITVFLCGKARLPTRAVNPGPVGGKMIPAFFTDRVCFCHYAESGESANTFIAPTAEKKLCRC